MNYLHILCEGKSELVFTSYVLSPYLIMKGIQVIPQALINEWLTRIENFPWDQQ